MQRSTVALVRCESYDPEAVYAALKRGVEHLGGLEQFARPGERLLLKPNILAGDPPEKAVATHPAVLEGCVRLFREGGARVSFGDSPGLENALQAATRAGLLAAARRSGAEWGDFSAASDVENLGGKLVTHFPLARAVQECDGIINLPKLKTHQLTRVTGAVKNLFGCIPGKRKGLYHVQFREIADFAGLLVELSLRLRPRLHILDAVVAMEGNGPRSGDPRALNVLALSNDPVALDATLCRLVALEPGFVPTNVIGAQMGLGRCAENEIAYAGEPLEALACPDFKLIRKPVYANASYAFYPWIKQLLLPRPAIEAARCTHCGRCVQACPVPEKALAFREGQRHAPPVYHYERCIRCYCCHEMCPSRAIVKKTPVLGHLLQVA